MDNQIIQKIRLYGIVALPSALSLVISIIISLTTLFFYNITGFLSYFEINGKLRITNFVLIDINRVLSLIFGSQGVDTAVLVFFWGSVGLIVYFIGNIIVKDIGELSTDVDHLHHYVWPKNTHPNLVRRFFERFLFSLAILIVFIVYSAHVLGFFLHGKIEPLYIFGSGLSKWLVTHDVIRQVVFVLAEIIALQGVVILVRLFFMRNRLFP